MGAHDRKPGEGETESYGDSTTRLVVTQPEGFAVKVCDTLAYTLLRVDMRKLSHVLHCTSAQRQRQEYILNMHDARAEADNACTTLMTCFRCP